MVIEKYFPVQEKLIPIILNNDNSQSLYANDLCVTAPTGSGKTLTYVIPIVSLLKTRIKPCIRAIVIVPVNDLADQVYNVFKEYAADTDLNIQLLSTKHPFSKEQASLIDDYLNQSLVDIIVATPGRLVDHIQKTKGFCLNNLNYLILDECDRIMDQIKQNWLQCLYEAVNLDQNHLFAQHINVNNLIETKSNLNKFQKLLFSATLTRNPEQLEQLKLFQPIYHSVVASNLHDKVDKSSEKAGDEEPMELVVSEPAAVVSKEKAKLEIVEGDLSIPEELNQVFIECPSTDKPLIAIYLLKMLKYRHMLVFVKTIDTAKRLCKLLELNNIKSVEYSSSLHISKRKRIISKFEEEKYDCIVCSDLIARGMDIKNVDYVLLYDAPTHLNSYIHRIGRTGRAGKYGTAITLLEHKEIYFFKKMIDKLATTTTTPNNKKLKEIKVTKSKLKPLINDYKQSLTKLKDSLTTKTKQKQINNKKIRIKKMK